MPLSLIAAPTVTLPGPVNTSSRVLPIFRLPPEIVASPEPTFMMPFKLSDLVPEAVSVLAAPVNCNVLAVTAAVRAPPPPESV